MITTLHERRSMDHHSGNSYNKRSQNFKTSFSSSESPAIAFEQNYIEPALQRREDIGSLRELKPFHSYGTVDFSSNDYIGLAQSPEQHDLVETEYKKQCRQHYSLVGSTGSRLLTGDSTFAHMLEDKLATWHNRSAALLCNSGYDANLTVLSCLTRNCVVIMDELCHNSLQMGVRLSKDCEVMKFNHNDVKDLERVLGQVSRASSRQPYHDVKKSGASTMKGIRNVLVVVESVYSMDGDVGPLKEVLQLSMDYQACVIVDEAHGLGVFGGNGMGVLEEYGLENHPALLTSIHTFGKAAGCHGAVVCGSKRLKEFLFNYGPPMVYSTSLPLHSLVCTYCSYMSMRGSVGQQLRDQVFTIVQHFRHGMNDRIFGSNLLVNNNIDNILVQYGVTLLPSYTPIQALVIPGNDQCVQFCKILWKKSNHRILLYPIRSPTVPKGQERVRIILHSHNTISQVNELIDMLEYTLQDMGFLPSSSSSSSSSYKASKTAMETRSRL